MKYDIQWGPDDEATVRSTGHCNRALVEKIDAEVYNDPRFDNLRKVICDFSGLDTAEVTVDDVEELSYTNAVVGSCKHPFYCAYIAPPDADLRRLLEHYVSVIERLNERWAYRIFDNLAEARNWLAGF